MSATLRFSNGIEAVLRRADDQWECENETLKAYLRLVTRSLPYKYYTDGLSEVAHEVAKRVGATVVRIEDPLFDPIDPKDVPPDIIY